MATSRFLKERKELLRTAEYTKALLVSKFDEEIPNSVKAEEKMDSLSDKPFFSSFNSLNNFLRQNTFDLIECGNIVPKNVKQLESLCKSHKVICIIRPSSRFIGSKFNMQPWISSSNTIQLVSEILGKQITYFNYGKEALCYIF